MFKKCGKLFLTILMVAALLISAAPVVVLGAVTDSEALFVVPTVKQRAGRQVKVAVQLQDNPGIVASSLKVSYDNAKLRLTAVENGTVFSAETFMSGDNLAKIPFTTIWTDALALENNTSNGTIVTYTFDVLEGVPAGLIPVTITVSSVFDKDLAGVAFTVTNGGVDVQDSKPGDAGGDGETDLRDVVQITRYLAGDWDVEIDDFAADVNGDGVVNLKDVTILRRYLAGWENVTIV